MINDSLIVELKKLSLYPLTPNGLIAYQGFSTKSVVPPMIKNHGQRKKQSSLPPIRLESSTPRNFEIFEESLIVSKQPEDDQSKKSEHSLNQGIKDLAIRPHAKQYYLSKSNIPPRAHIQQKAQDSLIKQQPKKLFLSTNHELSERTEHLANSLRNRVKLRIKNESISKAHRGWESPLPSFESIIVSRIDKDTEKKAEGTSRESSRSRMKAENSGGQHYRTLSLKPPKAIQTLEVGEMNLSTFRGSVSCRRHSRLTDRDQAKSKNNPDGNSFTLDSHLIRGKVDSSQGEKLTKQSSSRANSVSRNKKENSSSTPRKELENGELPRIHSRSRVKKGIPFELLKIDDGSALNYSKIYFPLELNVQSARSSARSLSRTPANISPKKDIYRSGRRDRESSFDIQRAVSILPRPHRRELRSLVPNKTPNNRSIL